MDLVKAASFSDYSQSGQISRLRGTNKEKVSAELLARDYLTEKVVCKGVSRREQGLPHGGLFTILQVGA